LFGDLGEHLPDNKRKAASHRRESLLRENFLAMERGWRELAQSLSKLKAL
jgi:hypothetical protein